jgi:hypothetical protein
MLEQEEIHRSQRRARLLKRSHSTGALHTLIRRRLWIAAVLLISVRGLADATPVCNVRDFGANGDDVTLDTAAISSAVGTMIVFMHAANIQLHGITLRSSPNWTLHLQDDTQ